MRVLRFLALAAALVVPAAAAHAQVGVYVGPSVRYAAPVYGTGYYPRVHWDHRIYGRPYYGIRGLAARVTASIVTGGDTAAIAAAGKQVEQGCWQLHRHSCLTRGD